MKLVLIKSTTGLKKVLKKNGGDIQNSLNLLMEITAQNSASAS